MVDLSALALVVELPKDETVVIEKGVEEELAVWVLFAEVIMGYVVWADNIASGEDISIEALVALVEVIDLVVVDLVDIASGVDLLIE